MCLFVCLLVCLFISVCVGWVVCFCVCVFVCKFVCLFGRSCVCYANSPPAHVVRTCFEIDFHPHVFFRNSFFQLHEFHKCRRPWPQASKYKEKRKNHLDPRLGPNRCPPGTPQRPQSNAHTSRYARSKKLTTMRTATTRKPRKQTKTNNHQRTLAKTRPSMINLVTCRGEQTRACE